MSTWSGVEVGGFSMLEEQNSYGIWFFLPGDRVREIKQDGSGQEFPEGSFIGYSETA